MRTVTLDILNDKAMKLLKDLESLKLIRLRKESVAVKSSDNLVSKYKGAMTKQSVEELEKQLNELRNEWQ